MIGQFVLEGIFRDHLAKHGVQVELATELMSFEQDAEGVTAVLKRTASTAHESTETFRASYIIGADGAKGTRLVSLEPNGQPHLRLLISGVGVTRRQIGSTFEGLTKDGDGQVWADVRVENLSAEVSKKCLEPVYIMESELSLDSTGTCG